MYALIIAHYMIVRYADYVHTDVCVGGGGAMYSLILRSFEGERTCESQILGDHNIICIGYLPHNYSRINCLLSFITLRQ